MAAPTHTHRLHNFIHLPYDHQKRVPCLTFVLNCHLNSIFIQLLNYLLNPIIMSTIVYIPEHYQTALIDFLYIFILISFHLKWCITLSIIYNSLIRLSVWILCTLSFSQGRWNCPNRWLCGLSRTYVSGWRSTAQTSTKSTVTPSNSTILQVHALPVNHGIMSPAKDTHIHKLL